MSSSVVTVLIRISLGDGPALKALTSLWLNSSLDCYIISALGCCSSWWLITSVWIPSTIGWGWLWLSMIWLPACPPSAWIFNLSWLLDAMTVFLSWPPSIAPGRSMEDMIELLKWGFYSISVRFLLGLILDAERSSSSSSAPVSTMIWFSLLGLLC